MSSFIPAQTVFIHGLEGTSQGVKATLLRNLFPQIVIPDFRGSIQERMAVLEGELARHDTWTVIGSSLGGLMAALYTCQHPASVRKLILLAPALILPVFSENVTTPVDTTTLLIHGTQDNIVPLEPVQRIAEKAFKNLTFISVEDDHGLYKTVHQLDWLELLSS